MITVKAFFTATDALQINLCQFSPETGLIETADILSSRSNVYFAFFIRIYKVKETAALILVKYKLTIIYPSFTSMSPGTKEVGKRSFQLN